MTQEPSPSMQTRLDALFAKSRSARLRYPVGTQLDYPKLPTLIMVAKERLGQLHAALALADDGVRAGCHCAGTVTVELLGSPPPHSLLTLHLHRQMYSLWFAGDPNGVRLRDGQQILNRLAEWGITAPLEIIEEAQRSQTSRGPLVAALTEKTEAAKPDEEATAHKLPRKRRKK